MTESIERGLAVGLISELLINEQMLRSYLTAALPGGMELSHFSVLNHLAGIGSSRRPAQLARSFHVTRGAMTNTLKRLQRFGYVDVIPDRHDRRSKHVVISQAGIDAREAALSAIVPVINSLTDEIGEDQLRIVLPVLRALRRQLETA